MSKTVLLAAWVAAALLLASAMSSVVWEKEVQAAFPGENGRFLYCAEANRDLPCEIFSINPDGSGLMQLTHRDEHDPLSCHPGDTNPESSPDGKKIAFSRDICTWKDIDGDGRAETVYIHDIYVMNADGSGQRKVTDDPAMDGSPAWSPDGKEIAFHSNRDAPVDANYANSYDIYIANADGTGEARRITDWPGNEFISAWSPDGSRLLYVSTADTPAFPNPEGDSEIYAMNPDGSGVSRLTDNTVGDSSPDWSPDGSKIAFRSNRDGRPGIYKMNADGSEQAKMPYQLPCVDEPDNNYFCYGEGSPVWSPDGSKIAFLQFVNSEGLALVDVYTMNVDGSGVVGALTYHPWGDFDWAPTWANHPTPPDTTAPRVTSTVPTNKATGVDPTTNITATFSEDILASSINATTFKLFKKGSTTKLSATVSYSASTNTATLDPTDSLRRGLTYRAVVSTKAKDLAGNPLDQNGTKPGLQQKRWSFTVTN